MSVDAAAGLLADPADQPQQQPAAAPEAAADAGAAEDTEIPADPSAEEPEAAQPEEAAAEGEEDQGEVEPEPAPAIEPPTSWDAEAKAVFAQLPAELQTKVAEIQAQRDRQTTQALERAAETTRAAEARAAETGQLKTVLDQLLPRAQQVFAGRWDGIDWAGWAAQDPATAFAAKEQMQADQAELNRLQTAKRVADHQQYQAFLQTEGQRLAQVAPDLADPVKGPAVRQELKGFLNQAGFDDQVIGQANATMMSLAYDAMRFRALQAQAQQQLGARPTPPPARPGLRPTPPRSGSSQTRQVDQLSRRLSQTGKAEDAVALLLARGG